MTGYGYDYGYEYGSKTTTPPANVILMEDGSILLLETGDHISLES